MRRSLQAPPDARRRDGSCACVRGCCLAARGTSKPIEQQNISGLSSSRLLVHFSTPRPNSFPLSVSYSSERMVATRVGLLEDEQDSFVPGGGLLIEVDQDLPTKVDQESDVSHRELCIAHTGLSHAVHDTCAGFRSVLSASVPTPQKTKLRHGKRVLRPRTFCWHRRWQSIGRPSRVIRSAASSGLSRTHLQRIPHVLWRFWDP